MKLTELLSNNGENFSNDFNQPYINYLNRRSIVPEKDMNQRRILFGKMKHDTSIMEGFKLQVKSSLEVINSPKSVLFGRGQIIGKSYTSRIASPPRNLTGQQVNSHREIKALKHAQNIIQARKIDSADWANLKNSLKYEVTRKQLTNIKTDFHDAQITNQTLHSNLSRSTLKQQMNEMHNTFYRRKLVPENVPSLSSFVQTSSLPFFTNRALEQDSPKTNFFRTSSKKGDQTNPFRKPIPNLAQKNGKTSLSRQLEFDTRTQNSAGVLQSSFAKTFKNSVLKDQDFEAYFRQEQENETQKSIKADNETEKHEPKDKFKHKIMTSLCMAQIKPIKGGNVKKLEKLKFQHYYDSVSERLHDIRQTRNLIDIDSTTPTNCINWQKIHLYESMYLTNEGINPLIRMTQGQYKRCEIYIRERGFRKYRTSWKR